MIETSEDEASTGLEDEERNTKTRHHPSRRPNNINNDFGDDFRYSSNAMKYEEESTQNINSNVREMKNRRLRKQRDSIIPSVDQQVSDSDYDVWVPSRRNSKQLSVTPSKASPKLNKKESSSNYGKPLYTETKPADKIKDIDWDSKQEIDKSSAPIADNHIQQTHQPQNRKENLIRDPSVLHSTESGVDNEVTDDEHTRDLQIYIFVCRIVAFTYGVNKKPDNESDESTKAEYKLSKADIKLMRGNFQSYLSNEGDAVLGPDFREAIQKFYDQFMLNENFERLAMIGSLTFTELHEIFNLIITEDFFPSNKDNTTITTTTTENIAETNHLRKIWSDMFDMICDRKLIEKQIQRTPSIHEDDKQNELYKLFQAILNVKDYEHQIIFNACQLSNKDEQLSCMRREIATRQKIYGENKEKETSQDIDVKNQTTLDLVDKSMADTYHKEREAKLKDLISFDDIVTRLKEDKRGRKRNMLKKAIHTVVNKFEKKDMTFLKDLGHMDYTFKVTVLEASGVEMLKKKKLFVVMEVEGDENLQQTDMVEASNPFWETQGNWIVKSPVIAFRVQLIMEKSTFFSLTHEKHIAKLFMKPHCGMNDKAQWHTMIKAIKNTHHDDVKIKLKIEMEKPEVIKKCGFLYSQGKSRWQNWKMRFFVLMQVNGYKMVLCTFTENRKYPYEWVNVEGFTVDFTHNRPELVNGGFFFHLTNVGDEIIFSSETDSDRMNWIFKLYTATGQKLKPEMQTACNKDENKEVAQANEHMARAKRYGLDVLIKADPFMYDQAYLFRILQRSTLQYQLNDAFATRGALTKDQLFILEIYCNRYDVRFCQRHVDFLQDLLTEAKKGVMICPSVFDSSYSALYPLMKNMKLTGVAVTKDELCKFEKISWRLHDFLYNQLVHFQKNFLLEQPVGALQETIALLRKVILYDSNSITDADRILDGCMKKAAITNYNNLCLENNLTDSLSNKEEIGLLLLLKKLTEVCLTHAKDSKKYRRGDVSSNKSLFKSHDISFWLLYTVDTQTLVSKILHNVYMEKQIDDVSKKQNKVLILATLTGCLQVFHMVNEYCRNEECLANTSFHQHLSLVYLPVIIQLMDEYEKLITKTLYRNMKKETYAIYKSLDCCKTEDQLYTPLRLLHSTTKQLIWPVPTISAHIQQRFQGLVNDLTHAFVKKCANDYVLLMKSKRNDVYFVIPTKCSWILNTISYAKKQEKGTSQDVDVKNQLDVLCPEDQIPQSHYLYHVDMKTFFRNTFKCLIEQMLNKVDGVLSTILKRLTRLDADYPYRKVLKFFIDRTDVTEGYFDYITDNIVELRREVHDDFIRTISRQALWNHFCSRILAWLEERKEVALELRQLHALKDILQITEDIIKNPLTPDFLFETREYSAVKLRLQSEEMLTRYYAEEL